MYVQRCAKGIAARTVNNSSGIDDAEAISIIDDQEGILCNWWRNKGTITPAEIFQKLNSHNLDRHVHDYPRFSRDTPFISLAAGATERDKFLRTNHLYPAEQTAVAFATNNGQHDGYVFFLWVVVGINAAVEAEHVAEEIRNLSVYRRWSPFQLEGEVTAKIHIPAIQIQRVDKWEGRSGVVQPADRTLWPHVNPDFREPDLLANIRELY